MILDEEVFAVILAISVVASVIGIAMILRPEIPEPFSAIGLLNENCKIGKYPESAISNTYLNLCISVSNYMGKPMYYKVVFKIGDNTTLPSNESPSPVEPIMEWYIVLGNKENQNILVDILVYADEPLPRTIALIFELWYYDTTRSTWNYTGLWVHNYIKVYFSPVSG
ncbi:MAG: hypothetical protein QXE81_03440 [Desulfurococcaceae archaeon]